MEAPGEICNVSIKQEIHEPGYNVVDINQIQVENRMLVNNNQQIGNVVNPDPESRNQQYLSNQPIKNKINQTSSSKKNNSKYEYCDVCMETTYSEKEETINFMQYIFYLFFLSLLCCCYWYCFQSSRNKNYDCCDYTLHCCKCRKIRYNYKSL